jgi:MoaA/NifB/PqqE/SkfB family radical SAM enzyme
MVPLAKLRSLPDRFPLSCQWEITCRCNLHCVMCYTDCCNRPEFIRQELTTTEILRILDEMADAGTLELCLTGGEPLSRPDFFSIYDYAVRRGFLVTVFTNATLITDVEADRFAALPPHGIEISLHGSTSDTFERITQSHGSYQRCLRAIRSLLDRHLPVVLKATALSLNQHEIVSIKQYAASLDSVPFKLGQELRPELDGGAGPFQYALSERELTELSRKDPRLWEESCQRSQAELPPCTSGMQRFHIDAYGRLQLCSGNRRQGYDLRNGSFREGFFEVLPTFACEHKKPEHSALLQPMTCHE